MSKTYNIISLLLAIEVAVNQREVESILFKNDAHTMFLLHVQYLKYLIGVF